MGAGLRAGLWARFVNSVKPDWGRTAKKGADNSCVTRGQKESDSEPSVSGPRSRNAGPEAQRANVGQCMREDRALGWTVNVFR